MVREPKVEGLYAIVDVPHRHGLVVEDVVRAVLGNRLDGGEDGAAIVQLRAKQADTEGRVRILERIAPACLAAGVLLVVDDDVDAAVAAVPGVGGVHLGQHDRGFDDVEVVRARAQDAGLHSFVVGISTHDPVQLRAACRQSADYVAYGPVCATSSKAAPDPVVGFDGLLHACRLSSRPVVAIGGMDLVGARRAATMGASAVAVIGALVHSTYEHTREAACRFARELREAARPLDHFEVHRRVPVVPVEQLVDLARWSDHLGVHVELGLPVRFRPWIRDGKAWYRPADIVDLLYALDKKEDESWERWARRAGAPGPMADLVQLRARG